MSVALASPALEQAAEWFALRQQGWSDGDQRRWHVWLQADAGHADAWRRVEAVWQSFAPLSAPAAATALDAAGHRRRRALRSLGGALGIGAVSILGLHGLQAQRHLQTQRTAAGHTGHWTLADGSQLWLNANSEVTIDIGNGHRALHLLRGEMLLQTGHHPAFADMPLSVHVPGARLQPIGTRFAVGREAQGSRLDVFEGAVRCLPLFGPSLDVPVGGAVQIGPMGGLSPVAADPLRGDWQEGRLQVQDTPMIRIIDELARHHQGYLGCDPALAALKATAVLPRLDSLQALKLLARALPIRIEQRWPWWTVVRPR
ncbi:TPA: FecR domain-containing protein [Stenotrophomonas maltophilia]|jgi:transmembrane sensor|uniref:FecR family protein n=1 Tax=Stenotrophomonas maltophilia TaxID=40324 RepID=UPI000C15C8FB|nr:FecR domain-containing protein [Stenotrophomonas maltophilia]MBN4993481.1 FecR domain-containing protein [Stenotrophomonas maltophilia]HEL3159429.1 FecR domain-containing protein [Stenotrophomonas maltophilia]